MITNTSIPLRSIIYLSQLNFLPVIEKNFEFSVSKSPTIRDRMPRDNLTFVRPFEAPRHAVSLAPSRLSDIVQ